MRRHGARRGGNDTDTWTVRRGGEHTPESAPGVRRGRHRKPHRHRLPLTATGLTLAAALLALARITDASDTLGTPRAAPRPAPAPRQHPARRRRPSPPPHHYRRPPRPHPRQSRRAPPRPGCACP
ncbi:hypothetical protein ACFQ3Z_28885 [Streptomyces nogalater]